MPHPAGSISYVPQAKAWFPRSYITTLKVHTNHVNVPSFADGLITWVHSPLDAVTGYTKIRDNVYDWNSNVYSLDFVVEYWYYVISPSPVEFEWGGEISITWDNTVKRTCLVVATVAADTDYYFPLPSPTAPYWTRAV